MAGTNILACVLGTPEREGKIQVVIRDTTSIGLLPDEMLALSARGVVRSYPRNTILLTEGDQTDALYLILSGRVKIFVSDAAGKEVVLGTQGPGEFFGEMALDGGPRSASVMTSVSSRLAVIPKANVRDLVRDHPEFAAHLIEKLIGRIRILTENFKGLALLDVYGRVARLLLDLAIEEDGELVIAERLTHQDIASRVGASREMISKILKGLAVGGYISVDRRRITLNKKLPQHW